MNELIYEDCILRPVRPEDAIAITGIYNHYVRHTTVTFEEEPLDVDDMRRRVDSLQTGYPFIVAVSADGTVIGYCHAHPWKKYSAYRGTLETTVYLRDGHTSRGLGRRLMCALIEECRRGGFHALIACITADNDGSLRFHESLGFVKVSHFHEVGRKFNRWLDVVDMELVL